MMTSSVYSDEFSQKLKPFLNKYCVSCHGPDKQKGKLRLDNISMNFSNFDTAEQWQFILDELNGATMPPEDEPQPSNENLTEVLEILTYQIEKAKKVHEGKKLHKCSKCDVTFSQKGNLERHIRTIHECEKHFVCQICNERFSLKGNLKRHVSTVHEGKKQFKCPSCNERFGIKKNMERHATTVHETNKSTEFYL